MSTSGTFENSAIINDALRRISTDYGVNASTDLKNKRVDKFGKMSDLGTSARTVTQLAQEEELEVIGSNAVDAVSSSDAADVGLTVTYEGLYYDADDNLQFGTGTAVLNGQNNVALNRGYNEITRARVAGQPAGDVWFGEGNTLTGGVPASADRHNVIRGTLGFRQTYKGQTSFSHRDWGIATGLLVSLRRNSGSNVVAEVEMQIADRVASGQPVFFPLFSPIALRQTGTSSLYIPLPGLIIPATNYVRVSAIGSTSSIGLDVTMFMTIAIDRKLA